MPFIQLHRKGSNSIYSPPSSTRGETELKNRFVRECSLSERLFQLVRAEVLRSFYWEMERGNGRPAASSACTLRRHSEACLTRKHLTATRGNRKPGGFTEPQVGGVVEAVLRLCRSSRSLFNTSTCPSCPDGVLTERRHNVRELSSSNGCTLWSSMLSKVRL